MQILCSVVESLVLPMLHPRQDFAFRCTIAPELISNNHSRDVLQSFEQLTKEAFRRFFVPSALNQISSTLPS